MHDGIEGHRGLLAEVVFPRFLDWIGEAPYRMCSWGFYDIGQLRLDCPRHGVALPDGFEDAHVNLKYEYATWQGVRRVAWRRCSPSSVCRSPARTTAASMTHATSP